MTPFSSEHEQLTGERRAIGYTVEYCWCLKCAPEGVSANDPIREGDDHGFPYHCDDCGEPLAPDEAYE